MNVQEAQTACWPVKPEGVAMKLRSVLVQVALLVLLVVHAASWSLAGIYTIADTGQERCYNDTH